MVPAGDDVPAMGAMPSESPAESGARAPVRSETLHATPGTIGKLDRAPKLPRPGEPLPPATMPDPIPEEDRTGEVLSGRYRLLERATRGGSGYVYRAQHVAIGKQVAVKVLHQHFVGSPEQRERFLREAQMAAKISHDNVIDLIDHGETEDGIVYVVMEWLDGEDLGETLARDAPLPWKRTKQISLQICRALHAAHSRGVLHRDLKPENVFRIKRRSNRDFVKLLDFGLAKAFGDETEPQRSLTKTGSLFGTPEYMSPEQAKGLPPDHRTDIYSLGIMMYEMLTGSVPFEAENYVGVLVKHASEIPVAPSKKLPRGAIDKRLDQIVLRALAKDPRERYPDIREFAQSIADVPVEPAGGSAVRTSDDALARRVSFLKRIVWMLSLALILLSLALVLALA